MSICALKFETLNFLLPSGKGDNFVWHSSIISESEGVVPTDDSRTYIPLIDDQTGIALPIPGGVFNVESEATATV